MVISSVQLYRCLDCAVERVLHKRQVVDRQPRPPPRHLASARAEIPIAVSPEVTRLLQESSWVLEGADVGVGVGVVVDVDGSVAEEEASTEALAFLQGTYALDFGVSNALQNRQVREKQPSPPLTHPGLLSPAIPAPRSPGETALQHVSTIIGGVLVVGVGVVDDGDSVADAGHCTKFWDCVEFHILQNRH